MADAVWFLGATDDAWPASGPMHPLLPFAVQRDAAMPHASAKLDWELARAMTVRLLASAPEVHFSYARQGEAVDGRASRLAEGFAGPPEAPPGELVHVSEPQLMAVGFQDMSRIPLQGEQADGGSTVLTVQSECPFKAFATARMRAQGWEYAQAGLTPLQRGKLLHAVLHSVWGGPPAGIRTHAELLALADLRGFVEGHALRAMVDKVPAGVSEQMPRRYLETRDGDAYQSGVGVAGFRAQTRRVFRCSKRTGSEPVHCRAHAEAAAGPHRSPRGRIAVGDRLQNRGLRGRSCGKCRGRRMCSCRSTLDLG